MPLMAAEPPVPDDDSNAQDSEWALGPDAADSQVHLDMNLLSDRIKELDDSSSPAVPNSPTQVVDISIALQNDTHLAEVDADFLKDFDNVSSLWVILFTATADGSEGVYSLTVGDENIVLAFQQRSEAQRYALCLEAQDFPVPQVCELDTDELRQFCEEAGFRLGFVPSGSLISPPDESAIDDIDKWRGENDTKARDGTVGMSEEDIDIMKKRLDNLFGQ